MTINIYKTAADNRRLDKLTGATLLNNTPITVKPTDKISVLEPVFEIDYDAAYMTANYVYCDVFDSYYYCTTRINTAQRVELVCAIDVRQTFPTAIKNASCDVIRAESLLMPTLIPDDKLPVNPSKKVVTSIKLPETSKTFGTDKEYSYLLTVVGGTPSI